VGGKGSGTSKTKSEIWAQPTPLTLGQALKLLNALKAKLYPAELAARLDYFSEAEARIRNSGGVCAPYSKSIGPYPQFEDHVKNGIRVDIDVKAGEAFVP
jgi:hypothetical protein